jgi:hypothetical protein
MANNSITIEPSAKPSTPDVADRIFVGPGRGANTLHKVGSAKQYATKSVVGRVCNQAKFPMSDRKDAPRKKG